MNVFVTGANGFIGAHIIRQLADHPSDVIASIVCGVRDIDRNILDVSSLSRAFSQHDITVVIHTACPVTFEVTGERAMKLLVQPACQGSLNILEAALANRVRRVVVTSSLAAILDLTQVQPGKIYTESDWNTTSTLEHAYRFAKTEAERRVWEWSKKYPQLEIVCILPSMTIGSTIDGRETFSVARVKSVLAGEPIDDEAINLVHVDDVALAHIRAASASGVVGERIIVGAENWFWDEVAQMKRDSRERKPNISNAKSIQLLNLKYKDITETLGAL